MDTQLLLLLMLLQMQSYILMFFVVSRFAAFTGWTRDPLDAFTGWTRDFDWREQRELQQEYFQCLHFLGVFPVQTFFFLIVLGVWMFV